jgi:hypothetical protein
MSLEERLLPNNLETHQSGRAMCAYFEDVWRMEDMENIQEHGFDTVVLCLREEQLADMQADYINVAQHARNIGLDVWVDLWAFAGIMGGDIPSVFETKGERADMDNPNFTKLFEDGIDYAHKLGGSAIFWDELNFNKRPDHIPVWGEERRFMQHVTDYSAQAALGGLKNAICLTSTEPHMRELADMANMRNVHYIGTDPYYYPGYPGANGDHPTDYVGKWAKRVTAIASTTNTIPFTFVQGFGLGKDTSIEHWSEVPLMQAQAAVDAKIDGITLQTVGFWGFNACRGTPNIDDSNNWLLPGDPDTVWKNSQFIRPIVDGRISYDLSAVPGLQAR